MWYIVTCFLSTRFAGWSAQGFLQRTCGGVCRGPSVLLSSGSPQGPSRLWRCQDLTLSWRISEHVVTELCRLCLRYLLGKKTCI